VQEGEAGTEPSATELEEKLTITSSDETAPKLNGRIVVDTTPVPGLNGTVFADF